MTQTTRKSLQRFPIVFEGEEATRVVIEKQPYGYSVRLYDCEAELYLPTVYKFPLLDAAHECAFRIAYSGVRRTGQAGSF